MIQARSAALCGTPGARAFSLEVDFQRPPPVTVFGPAVGQDLILDAIAGVVAPRKAASCWTDEILFDASAACACLPGGALRLRLPELRLFPHHDLRRTCLAAERRPRWRATRVARCSALPSHPSPAFAHELSAVQKQRLLDAPRPSSPPQAACCSTTSGLDAPARRVLRRAAAGPRRVRPHSAGHPRPRRVLRAGRRDADSARGAAGASGSPRAIAERPSTWRSPGCWASSTFQRRFWNWIRSATSAGAVRSSSSPDTTFRRCRDRVWLCVRPERLGVFPGTATRLESDPGATGAPSKCRGQCAWSSPRIQVELARPSSRNRN